MDGNAQDDKNLRLLIGDSGILVDTAFHTEEALRMIEEANHVDERYHMVLLDWDTPDTGGIQMAEKIRKALPENALLLFLTAYGADGLDSMEEALKLEYTGVLMKPFFVSALKEKVMEIQAGLDGENRAVKTDDDGSLEGLRFLAAEDNEINAEILSEILSMEGADCEIAQNGRLALERFGESKEGEFDAILMDVQMPVMNGYEATRAIRALRREDAKTIPIIAMTANAFAEDEKEALHAGMNVHLSKPIDIGLLKKVVKQYVGRT